MAAARVDAAALMTIWVVSGQGEDGSVPVSGFDRDNSRHQHSDVCG